MADPRKPDETWSEEGPVSAVVDAPPVADSRYAPTGEVLGRGGLGRVDAVRDRDLGREVARKQMLTDDRGLRERFLREARITAQIEHPGVVPVYELGQDETGRPYYTMRRIRGRTLGSVLGDCKTLAQRLGLLPAFVAACQAVGHAHSKGVVHRDLKPENVMVGEFGEVLVVDWGLAKARDDEAIDIAPSGMYQAALPRGATLTRMGATMGTPAFMSPEQARGETHLVDARSDVWALGALLFEILAGRPLFQESDGDVIIARLCAGRFEDVARAIGDAPPDLVAIVTKALAPRPNDRYPDAHALAQDVVAWQAGGLVDAYHYTFREVISRSLRRHRFAVVVAAVAMVGVGALTAVSYVGIRSERDRAVDAESVAERRGAEARERLAGSLAGASAASLRGGDALSAYVLALGSLEIKETPEARGALIAASSDPLPELSGDDHVAGGCVLPTFASDGSLACFTDDGIRVWRSFPGPSTLLPLEAATARESWALSWSPDTQHLAGVRYDGTLWVWNTSGGPGEDLGITGLVHATFLDDTTLLLSNETGGLGRITLTERVARWSTVHATVRFDTLVPSSVGVVAGSVVDPVGVWDPATDVFEPISPPMVAPLVAASADGKTVLAASGWGGAVAPVRVMADGTVRDLGPPRAVSSMALSADGLRAVTTTGRVVDVWDGPDWRRVVRVPADAGVIGAALSPDGVTLVLTEDDGDVRSFHLPPRAGRRPNDAGGTVWELRITEDGKQVVTGGNDGWLRVWDLASGDLVTEWLVDPSGLGSIVLAGRDAIVATNARGLVRVGLDDGRERWAEPFDGTVNALERLGTDAMIVTDASGFVVRVGLDGALGWRTGVGRWAVSGVEDARGRVLASADLQAIWLDANTGAELGRGPGTTVIGPMFPLPDGGYAATGRAEVTRYDAEGKGPTGRWSGRHEGRVRSFVRVDDHVLTGADDGRLCLWTLGGLVQACWEGHASTIWRVELAPSLAYAASGGADGATHRWNLALRDAEAGPLLAEARTRFGLAPGDGQIVEVGPSAE